MKPVKIIYGEQKCELNLCDYGEERTLKNDIRDILQLDADCYIQGF